VTGEEDPAAVDGGMDQAGAVGGVQAGEVVAAEAIRPVGGQRGVGAAGDCVFGDAAGWCEAPGDKIVATAPARRGGDDDPADAIPAGEAGQGGETALQRTDRGLVADGGEQVSELPLR
jgi:hypothetical protein